MPTPKYSGQVNLICQKGKGPRFLSENLRPIWRVKIAGPGQPSPSRPRRARSCWQLIQDLGTIPRLRDAASSVGDDSASRPGRALLPDPAPRRTRPGIIIRVSPPAGPMERLIRPQEAHTNRISFYKKQKPAASRDGRATVLFIWSGKDRVPAPQADSSLSSAT